MDYAHKTIDTRCNRPQEANRILLWEFPEEDFAAYLAMPDTPPLESYSHYLATLAAIQAEVEKTGRLVRRLRAPVAAVVAELARHHWPNDTQHRVKIIEDFDATGGN